MYHTAWKLYGWDIAVYNVNAFYNLPEEISWDSSYVDAAEELIGVKQADYESNETEKKKPLHIIMQMWAEAGSFDRIAKAGNSVDEEIVEQFRNALPPIYNGENLLQADGAYSHILVEELGVYAPTYATFKRL